jgi:hypothetical protein
MNEQQVSALLAALEGVGARLDALSSQVEQERRENARLRHTMAEGQQQNAALAEQVARMQAFVLHAAHTRGGGGGGGPPPLLLLPPPPAATPAGDAAPPDSDHWLLLGPADPGEAVSAAAAPMVLLAPHARQPPAAPGALMLPGPAEQHLDGDQGMEVTSPALPHRLLGQPGPVGSAAAGGLDSRLPQLGDAASSPAAAGGGGGAAGSGSGGGGAAQQPGAAGLSHPAGQSTRAGAAAAAPALPRPGAPPPHDAQQRAAEPPRPRRIQPQLQLAPAADPSSRPPGEEDRVMEELGDMPHGEGGGGCLRRRVAVSCATPRRGASVRHRCRRAQLQLLDAVPSGVWLTAQLRLGGNA